MHAYLVFIAALYGIGTLVALILTRTVSDGSNLVAMFSSTLHILLFPALVIFPLALLMRDWKLAALILPLVLAFVLLYGTFFKPHRTDAYHNGPTLTVLTFNLHKDDGSVEQMMQIIRDSDASVVAVQELSYTVSRALKENLADIYPYMALHPQLKAESGQGLLSKYPIAEEDFFHLARVHQRAVLDVDGKTVVVYNSHLVQPLGYRIRFTLRTEEVQELLSRIAQESDPVIWLGDFNMTDQSDDYARITDHFSDAFREAGYGMGFTYPASGVRLPFALFRLDYVFYSNGIDALEAERLSAGSSDHHPVFVRLAI